MIHNREELREILKREGLDYLGIGKNRMNKILKLNPDYLIWRFVKALRHAEYHFNTGHTVRYYLWERRKNRLGAKLGISIWCNTIDAGLRIWHYGSVIVNGSCKIGKNCQLHGENCIGNRGKEDAAVPVIGDNVDIGVGAKIIGDIYIASGCTIGANAVVTKSCHEEGAVLVGIPARVIRQETL